MNETWKKESNVIPLPPRPVRAAQRRRGPDGLLQRLFPGATDEFLRPARAYLDACVEGMLEGEADHEKDQAAAGRPPNSFERTTQRAADFLALLRRAPPGERAQFFAWALEEGELLLPKGFRPAS